MSVSISGILLDPFGQPASFAEVKFITWQGANDVLTTAPAVFKTSADGAYSFAVEFSTYTVQVRYNQSNGKFQTIKQKVIVNSNTSASTLGELLLFNEPLTPPEIAYVEQLVADAEGYRDEAEGFALASEASSQASEGFSQASQISANDANQSAIDASNSAAAIVGVPLNGGVWAAGQTFTAYNQYMIFDGTPLAPLVSTPLPYGPVGATPDFVFVGPYPLNDHSKLSNLNSENGHDSIYSRRFSNVSQMVAYTGLTSGLNYSSGGTGWKYNGNSSGTIADFTAITSIVVTDFDVPTDGTDAGPSILAMLESMSGVSSDFDFVNLEYTINTPIEPTLTGTETFTFRNGLVVTTVAKAAQLWMFSFGAFGAKLTRWRNFEFDGKDAAQRGIYSHKSIDIDDTCDFHNFWSELSSAICVHLFYAEISAGDTETANIFRSTFRDCDGVSTGAVGQSAGTTRAILIQQPLEPLATAIVNIEHNDLRDFYGREGDIIHVLCSAAKTESPNDMVNIKNNKFGGSNRRTLKVQGWNVDFSYNEVVTIDDTNPNYGLDGQGGAGVLVFAGATGSVVTTGHRCVGNEIENNGGIKESIFADNGKVDVISGNVQKSKLPSKSAGFLIGKNGGTYLATGNEVDQYTSNPVILSNGSKFIGNTINVYLGSYTISPGFTVNTDITISRNSVSVDSGAVGAYLGFTYFINYNQPFSNVLISKNEITVPEGTDTRTRCKIGYFFGSSGVIGDLTFADNFLNSNTSCFFEDPDLDYTDVKFKGNGTKYSRHDRILSAFGANLITNPRLETDATGWTVNAGSAYSADYGGIIANTGICRQSIAVTTGKTYMVKVKITGLGSVNFNLQIGTNNARTSMISSGYASEEFIVYVDYAGATGNANFSIIPVSANFVIDQCFVHEVT